MTNSPSSRAVSSATQLAAHELRAAVRHLLVVIGDIEADAGDAGWAQLPKQHAERLLTISHHDEQLVANAPEILAGAQLLGGELARRPWTSDAGPTADVDAAADDVVAAVTAFRDAAGQ